MLEIVTGKIESLGRQSYTLAISKEEREYPSYSKLLVRKAIVVISILNGSQK
ncbi:hypothetical protein GIB67_028414, partial [Kingdonia uniflora]